MNKPRSRKRRWTIILLAMSFGMLLFALVAEIGLRLAHISSPGYYMPDPMLASTLRPNTSGWWTKEGHAWVQINSVGMRDVERTIAKPAGTNRVAVLGDSYIEALQVALEDNLCQQLESRLNKTLPEPVEVLNFGVSGYGTAQQFLKLENEVWKFEPDVVLLCVYPGNDLRNNSKELEPEQTRPFFIESPNGLQLDTSFRESRSYKIAISNYEKWKMAFVNRSALLQFLKNLKAKLTSPANQVAPQTAIEQLRNSVKNDLYVYKDLPDAPYQQTWKITEKILNKVVQACQQKNVPLVVAVLSTSLQTYPEAQLREQVCNDFEIDDLFYASDRLAEWAQDKPVTFVDLARPLHDYAIENDEFIHGFENLGLGFGHWNETGHREAAKVLQGPLTELLK